MVYRTADCWVWIGANHQRSDFFSPSLFIHLLGGCRRSAASPQYTVPDASRTPDSARSRAWLRFADFAEKCATSHTKKYLMRHFSSNEGLPGD
jgi:hypothetical protein